MKELNVVICIDDTHPEDNWGMPTDKCTSYLHLLNQEFGCKFVQFIPSNYHGQFPISKNLQWIEYWNNLEWIELAAHGHYHDCRSGGPGECEMTEHDYESAKNRLDMCLKEWNSVGVKPIGWRMPGWLATQESFNVVSEYFDYVAIHEYHNNQINFTNNIKVFKGADGIHVDGGNINLWNGDTIMFQSHINGSTNENNWNTKNYENIKNILNYLKQNYNLKFKLLRELL